MTNPPLTAADIPIDDDLYVHSHVRRGLDYYPIGGKPKYRHKPTVLHAPEALPAEQRQLRNHLGIVKWMNERSNVLKEKQADSVNRFEMRKAEAANKTAKKRTARAQRLDLADRKAEMAEMAGVAPATPAPMPDYVARKIEEKQTAANMADWKRGKVHHRMLKFEHVGGIVADRDYAPFVEEITREDGSKTGLRSWNGSISTALFCRLLPATHRLAFGNDKEHLLRADMHSQKVFLLDSPYIELDRSRLGVLWVDLDTCWESEEALLDALRDLLGPDRMPNLISYRWSQDGTMLETPHLFWLLPPGSEVGTTGASREAPQFLFHDIQRRLISLLIPLGADIGARNRKVKNPLSPYWSIITNDSSFLDLNMRKDFLSKGINEAEMKRRAALHRVCDETGAEIQPSMQAWNDVLDIVKVTIKDAVTRKCPAYAGAYGRQATFEAWLLSKVMQQAITLQGDRAVIERIVRRQCAWRAKNRRSPQVSHFNRGRDEFINGMEGHDLTDKLEQAGRRTAAGQRKTSTALVVVHITAIIENGLPVTRAEVCKTIKSVSTRTAYRVYDAALRLVTDAVGYIAKPCTTTANTSPLPSSKVTCAAPRVTGAQRPVLGAPQQRVRWHRRPVIRDDSGGHREKYRGWSRRHREAVLEAVAFGELRRRELAFLEAQQRSPVSRGNRDPEATLH